MLMFMEWLQSELFNDVEPYQWQGNNLATFKVGNIPYNFNAYPVDVPLSDGRTVRCISVNFKAKATTAVGPKDDGFGITGSGNASTVLATVMAQIQEIIRRNPQAVIVFSAKEPSRQSLYKRLLKRIAPSYQHFSKASYDVGVVFVLAPPSLKVNGQDVDMIAEIE